MQARALLVPAARSAGCCRMDANGISQVSRRSVLCLCPAPRPRSNRRVLAVPATSMLPPRCAPQRLRQLLFRGSLTKALAPAVLRFAFRVATHAQGSLPAGWLAFAGRASNPLDRDERFQLVFTFIPLSCPPDASAISAAHCAACAQACPRDMATVTQSGWGLRANSGAAGRSPRAWWRRNALRLLRPTGRPVFASSAACHLRQRCFIIAPCPTIAVRSFPADAGSSR